MSEEGQKVNRKAGERVCFNDGLDCVREYPRIEPVIALFGLPEKNRFKQDTERQQ